MGGCGSKPLSVPDTPITVVPYNELDFSVDGNTRKKALLIGLNYRGSRQPLYGPENDASAIRQLLIDKYGYRPQDIILITERNFPARSSIADLLSNFLQGAKSGDHYFFYYSGHGAQVPDPTDKERGNKERDGKNEVLVNPNFTFTVDDRLNEIIAKLPADTSFTAIIDACNSGTVFDLPINYGQDGIELNSLPIQADVITLTAAADDELAYDLQGGVKADITNTGSGFEGLLTRNLIRDLQGSNPNWVELLSRLQSEIKKTGYKQTPQLAVSKQELLTRPVSL